MVDSNSDTGRLWYVRRAEREYGPFNEHKLRDDYRAGKLRADDLVWADGLRAWQLAKTAFGGPQKIGRASSFWRLARKIAGYLSVSGTLLAAGLAVFKFSYGSHLPIIPGLLVDLCARPEDGETPFTTTQVNAFIGALKQNSGNVVYVEGFKLIGPKCSYSENHPNAAINDKSIAAQPESGEPRNSELNFSVKLSNFFRPRRGVDALIDLTFLGEINKSPHWFYMGECGFVTEWRDRDCFTYRGVATISSSELDEALGEGISVRATRPEGADIEKARCSAKIVQHGSFFGALRCSID